MERSRLTRVKSKRATKQAVIYIIISVAIILGMITWGVPAAARLAGLLITEDTGIGGDSELRPTPPVFSDIPEATNSAEVAVSGFAQPGVEIALYVNGSEYKKILSDESGVFDFDNVAVTEGENTIYAFAITSRGQESEQSRSYSIAVDKKPPELTLTSPEDGHIYRGSTERIASFQGTVSEEGSRVTVGDRIAIVQTDGTFSLQYQMVEGDQEVSVKATDKAGNEQEVKVKIRWEP